MLQVLHSLNQTSKPSHRRERYYKQNREPSPDYLETVYLPFNNVFDFLQFSFHMRFDTCVTTQGAFVWFSPKGEYMVIFTYPQAHIHHLKHLILIFANGKF